MTTFHIITIFPDSIKNYFESSILARAQKKKLIKVKLYNPRDFVKDRWIDDKPYGGGPGMVMKIEPILKTISRIKNRESRIILLSPAGKQFDQKIAQDYAKKFKNIILICGHYEGVDERVAKILKAEKISVGPFVLSGGELGAGIIIDAVSRHLTGVLGKAESLEEKREGIGVPVYTRPEVFNFKGKKYRVPKILLSGHHENIKKWRRNV